MTAVRPAASGTPERTRLPARWARWVERGRAPVDGASLAVFRIAFGLVVVWESHRYLSRGWVQRYWVDPQFHFTYHGFGWVTPLPGPAMHLMWAGIGVLGVWIAVGLFTRTAALLFAVAFGYSFLLEAARYLNHFYLMVLLGLLLAVVPAHRVWSLDARLRPPQRPGVVPAWCLWLLRFQVAVVYVGGAVAKVTPDWLRGEPMRPWLAREDQLPLVGPLLRSEWVVYALTYQAIAFDAVVCFAVLWRRTRIPALAAALVFHVVNDQLFSIGVFPVLGFSALLLFCPPDWPRALWSRLGGGVRRAPYAAVAPAGTAVGPEPGPGSVRDTLMRRLRPVGTGLLAVYVLAQMAVPLRHHLYPGDPGWSEQGHTFAWHMKLRSKSGDAQFQAYDPATGRSTPLDPLEVLEPWQYRKMTIRPEMMREYAAHVAATYAAAGHPGIEVRAQTSVSLNGRPAAALVDPAVDLGARTRTLAPLPWVLPLTEPLP